MLSQLGISFVEMITQPGVIVGMIMVILGTVLSAVMGGMVIFMHRSNIQRLKNGTENKFSFSSKK